MPTNAINSEYLFDMIRILHPISHSFYAGSRLFLHGQKKPYTTSVLRPGGLYWVQESYYSTRPTAVMHIETQCISRWTLKQEFRERYTQCFKFNADIPPWAGYIVVLLSPAGKLWMCGFAKSSFEKDLSAFFAEKSEIRLFKDRR